MATSHFLTLCLFSLLASRSANAQSEVVCENLLTPTNEWNTGYQGWLRFALDHEVHGWVLTLSFDKPYNDFQCWYGDILSDDGQTVSLTNLDWDGDYAVGDTFEVEFQIQFDDGAARPQLMLTTLDDEVVCGEGSEQQGTTEGSVDPTTQGVDPTTQDVDPTTQGVDPTTQAVDPTTEGEVDPPPGDAAYNYAEALEKSILFYEAQRSGPLPSDNRIDYRYDSCTDDTIVGGYFDAGDHVKFGFPMASMTTQMAWGGVTWPNGVSKANQDEFYLEALKWATDYFIAAFTSDTEFYGQVGDGDADHAYWGRPEEMTMARPAFAITSSSPGSDLAGETAAALAAASMYYRTAGQTALADEALDNAIRLFDFANNYRGTYVNAIPAANFYNSWSGYGDELTWAAAWLAKATGDSTYITTAESLYTEFSDLLNYVPTEFSWDNKVIGANILLYELTGSSTYSSIIDSFVSSMLSHSATPGGMIFIDSWGACRHAANIAHAFYQIGALGIRTDEVNAFAESQINYILGDNPNSISYMIGFGDYYPLMPHHRSSSCEDQPSTCDWAQYDSPNPNPQVLNGALVGGPDGNDGYVDMRSDYTHNEVATDYNAGFQSALIALVDQYF